MRRVLLAVLVQGCIGTRAGERPDPPVLLTVLPAAPANDNAPRVYGEAAERVTVRLYGLPGCEGDAIGLGMGAALATDGIAAAVADDTSVQLSALAVNARGVESVCSEGPSFVEDSTPPAFAGVQSITGVKSGALRLSWTAASDAVSDMQSLLYAICRGTAPDGCSPFQTTYVTAPGVTSHDVADLNASTEYVFSVRALDEAGNEDNNTATLVGETCAVGYAFEAGGCVWSGGTLDSGFQDDAIWTATAGAVITTNHPGFDGDVGAAVWDAAAIAAAATVAQTVDMPSYGEAEPLVLQLHVLTSCGACAALEPAVGINDKWRKLQFEAGVWTENRLCLGESAYGGSVDVVLGNYSLNADVGDELAIDGVSIEPAIADECPAPGGVRDPTFDTATSWAFAGDGTAERATLEAGNMAAYLSASTTSVRSTGRLSVPSVGLKGLRFTYRGAYAGRLSVRLDDHLLGTAGDTDASDDTMVTLCLPEWSRGLAWDVTFETVPGASTATYWVDDIALVGSCTEADVAIYNADFEVPESYVSQWYGRAEGAASARIAATGGRNASLGAALSLTGCGTAELATTVVPTANGKLQFWATADTALGSATVTVNGLAISDLNTEFGLQTFCTAFASSVVGRPSALRLVLQQEASCVANRLNVVIDDIGYAEDCP